MKRILCLFHAGHDEITFDLRGLWRGRRYMFPFAWCRRCGRLRARAKR